MTTTDAVSTLLIALILIAGHRTGRRYKRHEDMNPYELTRIISEREEAGDFESAERARTYRDNKFLSTKTV